MNVRADDRLNVDRIGSELASCSRAALPGLTGFPGRRRRASEIISFSRALISKVVRSTTTVEEVA